MNSPVQSATFILIRHGETDWNVAGKFQGHTDIPLNKSGITQARCAAKKLSIQHPDITAIYSSDLLRAKQTALHSAEQLNLPVETRRAFRELCGGVAEGMTHLELDAEYLDKWKSLAELYPDRKQRWNYTPIPGQETINEQMHRIKEALVSIVKEYPNGKVAIFTHGGILKSFIAYMKDVERDHVSALSNCSVVEVLACISAEGIFFQLLKVEKGS